jgi:hypothetical protein
VDPRSHESSSIRSNGRCQATCRDGSPQRPRLSLAPRLSWKGPSGCHGTLLIALPKTRHALDERTLRVRYRSEAERPRLIEGRGRAVSSTRQLARDSRRVVVWTRTSSYTSIARLPKISRLCCTTRAGTRRPVRPWPRCRPSRRRDSTLSCTSWTTPSGVRVCPDANTGRPSRRVLSLDPPIGVQRRAPASFNDLVLTAERDALIAVYCGLTL